MKKLFLSISAFQHFSIVYHSSKNLLQIIDDILDFAKLKSGKFTIAPIEVNLKEVLEHTFSLFSKVAEKKSLHYELFLGDHFPDCFVADETRVVQILSNFINSRRQRNGRYANGSTYGKF